MSAHLNTYGGINEMAVRNPRTSALPAPPAPLNLPVYIIS